jgi:hypothetical protein
MGISKQLPHNPPQSWTMEHSGSGLAELAETWIALVAPAEMVGVAR